MNERRPGRPGSPGRPARSLRIIAILGVAGDLLVLQLSWLVASLAVVTALPAAFALQRCVAERLDEARDDDQAGEEPRTPGAWPSAGPGSGSAPGARVARSAGVRPPGSATGSAAGAGGAGGAGGGWGDGTSGRGFFRRFVVALRTLWPLGIAAPVLLAIFVFSALFWISAEGLPRILALAVLLPLGGIGLAVYLGMLGASPALDERAGVREVARAGWAAVLARPLRAAGCIVLLVTWLLLMTRLPTLLLITSGVVPALAAYWLAAPPREREPGRTGRTA
jgi:hypothetical protein